MGKMLNFCENSSKRQITTLTPMFFAKCVIFEIIFFAKFRFVFAIFASFAKKIRNIIRVCRSTLDRLRIILYFFGETLTFK